MASFLFCPPSAYGHIFPEIPIAQQLLKRGHKVLFYGTREIKKLILSEGLEHISPSLENDISVTQVQTLIAINDSFLAKWRNRQKLFKHLLEVADVQAHDITTTLVDRQIDVLVTDAVNPIASLVGESQGIPWATLCVSPCPIPSVTLPPYGPGFPLITKNFRSRLIQRAYRLIFEIASQVALRFWNQLRAKYGVKSSVRFLPDFSLSPYLYIVFSTESFDYYRTDLPRQVHYVGPSLWQPTERDNTSLMRFSGLRRPLIHATQGTLGQGSAHLLRCCVDAFRGEEMTLLVTTGTSVDHRLFDNLPENIIIRDFIPHSHLLPHVDVMITNGGYGGVLTALAYSVPLIVVPDALDHFEVAQRVVEANVGIRLSMKDCTPHKLRTSVDRIFSEPIFQMQAIKMKSEFAQTNGPERAAELLEQLALKGQPVFRAF